MTALRGEVGGLAIHGASRKNPEVRVFAHRWLPPAISVCFAAGLQLSGAVQPRMGYGLIVLSMVGSIVWVALNRQQPSATASARLADLFREGDDARQECRTVPEGSPEDKLRWALVGGTPQVQIKREARAREWDKRVADELWAQAGLKKFAPGWKAAGAPPPPPPSADQSHMNPSRLANFYEAKLAHLTTILERLGSNP